MRPHPSATLLALVACATLTPPSPAVASVPAAGEGPYPYVIVTGQAIGEPLLAFAKWRTRTGTRATVRSIESIRADYPAAADDAERVRRFLQDARAQWGTQWVLIAGDTDVIPVREAWVSDPLGNRLVPTDLYYACLDGSWNADGDGLYGEWPADDVDVVADLYLGRAPVSTRAEVQRFVDKTLRYERTPPPDYQTTVLVLAEVIELGMNDIDTAQMAEAALSSITDDPRMRVTRLYENHTSWPPPVYPENRPDARDSLSRGYNFVLGLGGGSPALFRVDDDFGPDPYLIVGDALGLTNGPRLSHVYLVTSSVNRITEPTALGEAFMRAEHGGAVTVIAPTDLTFLSQATNVMREYVRLVFDQVAGTVGEAFVAQMAPLQPGPSLTDRTLMYAELLLGDPRLPVYTLPPIALEVGHPEEVEAGTTTLEVAVRGGGAPLAGAAVTACVGDRPVTAVTDGAGLARVTLEAAPGEPVALTVTARNALPYEGEVTVANTPVAVGEGVATRFDLARTGSHPVRDAAHVRLAIPAALAGVTLDLAVFDLAGRRVRTIEHGAAQAGVRAATWDLRDETGAAVKDGLYLITATLGGARVARPIVVLR